MQFDIGRTSELQAVEFKRSGRFRLPRGGRRSTRPAEPSRRALSTSTRIQTSRFLDGTAQSAVRQGVTLDVIGESASVAPLEGVVLDEFKREQKRQYKGYQLTAVKKLAMGNSSNVECLLCDV